MSYANCGCAETIADDQQEDVEMLSEEDFERLSIYHVPDKPCTPYTFDRIRNTLPSNLTLLPSAAEPNVSSVVFFCPLHPVIA